MSTLDETAASQPPTLRPVPARAPAGSRHSAGRAPALARGERSRLFVEQLSDRRVPSDLRVSAGGQRVAFTVTRPGEAAGGSETSVWLSTASGSPRRIAGEGSASSAGLPRWSPDGRQLAAVVQPAGAPLDAEVVVFAQRFLEPTPIGTVTGRIEDLVWTADSSSVLVLCAEPGADSIVTSGAVRHTAPSRRHRPRVTVAGSGRRRVYALTVAADRPRAIGPRTGSIWELALSTAGDMVVLWSADPSESDWYDARLGVLDRDTATVKELYRPEWQLSPLAMAPASRRVAFAEGWSSDRGKVCGEIRVVDLATGAVTPLAWFGVDVVKVSWRSETTLWFAGWRGMAAAWGWVDLSGSVGAEREDDVWPATMCLPYHAQADARVGLGERTGAWAVSKPADGSPPQIVVGFTPDGFPPHRVAGSTPDPASDSFAWSPITRLSRGRIVHFYEADTRPVTWNGADGLRIDAVIAYPRRGDGRPAPLVVYAHGGPANLWSRSLTPEVRFLVDAGFAVLLPNPRGSVGRGQQFARANLGDAGGAELDDLVRGVQACAGIDAVDVTRVGVIGGSYGGYLAACAAARTQRFACAVVMFGHPDLLSARYGSNNPAFYDKLMLGAPASGDASQYVERSPIVHVSPATAPTLLLHGAEDRCCPIGQAEEMYRALIDSHVETKLVIYPGEGHGLHGIAARSDCWTRVADWLDRFLARHER